MAKKKAVQKKKPCNCVDKVNEMLAKDGVCLVEKPTLLCTYCPFCGIKYEEK